MSDNFVMNMLNGYADDHDVDAGDVFKHDTPKKSEPITPSPSNTTESNISAEQKIETPVVNKKREWRPDASLTDGMPELKKAGAVYKKDEVKFESDDKALKNLMDDVAVQESRESMDDMSRKLANIEEAKARHGITKLQIPPGEIQTRFMIAASDPDRKKSQELLDALLNEVKTLYPSMVLEYAEGIGPEIESGKINPVPEAATPTDERKKEEQKSEPEKPDTQAEITPESENPESDLKIVIDKSSLPTVSWNQEEVEKIKKSRSIELSIVEGRDIKFGNITDVSDNMVDRVLEKYHRKTNDVTGVLPASKYRATFSGLSYPEVLDLSTSQEMNNLDGERKKWSIAFDHIHNQSIGAWEEYYVYTDKESGNEVRINNIDDAPEGVETHFVSRFEDFLRKTSFMDLEFILWKILCATTMDKEIISIDCHALTSAGTECGHTYDWIYAAQDLLDMKSIPEAILKEMEEAGKAATAEEIMKIYKTSPVNSTDTVELSSSGFILVIGHISAYDYIENIYSVIKSLEESEESDPTIVSRGMAYATLTVIKAVLIPQDGGRYARVRGPEGIAKVLSKLDEYDWQAISEITKMAIDPYQFRYSLRDIVCPKCKNRSNIRIEDMSRMLFIVARSLSSVQVTLKKA